MFFVLVKTLTSLILLIMIVPLKSQNIYSYKIKTIEGDTISLEKYKGKVLLIVNTASACGYTPQLKELEELYQMYNERGFEILAFPSNDFSGQEPLNGEQIKIFCMEQYHITFPVFDKIHVKGKDAAELYKFLSDKKLNGHISSVPKWNFHKYLVNGNGEVVDFFYTITKPTSRRIKKSIEKLLGQNKAQ